MAGFPSPFGSDDDGLFDEYEEFAPGHIPDPNVFLEDHDVLTAEDHVVFHEITREAFEERKVYDMTFNYNLARLNLDTRHKAAGYRYAEETDDHSVLRAEFTPTTPFCPQTHTLTKGSFRAWNELDGRHDYELVKVRADPMHHESNAINEELEELEEKYLETGAVTVGADESGAAGSNSVKRTMEEQGTTRSSDPPF